MDLDQIIREVEYWRANYQPSFWRAIEVADELIAEVVRLKVSYVALKQTSEELISSAREMIHAKQHEIADWKHATGCQTPEDFVSAIQPGTQSAIIRELITFAESECGRKPTDSEPVMAAVKREFSRFRRERTALFSERVGEKSMTEQDYIDLINEDAATDPERLDRTQELIYADWLDEQGDLRGRGWRNLIQEGKRPRHWHEDPTWDWFPVGWIHKDAVLSFYDEIDPDGRTSAETYYAAMNAAAIAWVRANVDENFSLEAS